MQRKRPRTFDSVGATCPNAHPIVLAVRMTKWDVPYRQGVHDAMTVLRGRWTVAVLAALALGERQYGELLAAVNEVEERVGWVSHERPLTERTLTDTLRRANTDGLVQRRAEPGRFGAVWYGLTPMGRSLLRALRPLAEWAQQHREQTEGQPPEGRTART